MQEDVTKHYTVKPRETILTPEEWLTMFSQDRSPSKHTLRAYRKAVERFIDFMGRIDIDSASETEIRAYITALEQEGNRRVTIYQRLVPLKLYFKTLHASGDIEVDPFARIHYTPGKEEINRQSADSERRAIGKVEVKRLLSFNWATVETDEANRIRNKMIIALLVDTGRRVSDICRVLRDDINEQYILFEQTKSTNGQGKAPISHYTFDLIQKYISLQQDKKLNGRWKEGYLLAVNEDSIRIIVNYAVDALGLKKHRLNAHVIRHFVVTAMVQNGIDIKTISKITGMSPITLLSRYCHPSDEQIAQSHGKAGIIKELTKQI